MHNQCHVASSSFFFAWFHGFWEAQVWGFLRKPELWGLTGLIGIGYALSTTVVTTLYLYAGCPVRLAELAYRVWSHGRHEGQAE